MVLGWVGTRLSLSGPATIKTQQISIAESWRATAHNVTRIQCVATLLVVPVAIVILVLLLVFMHWLNTATCVLCLERFQYLLPLLLIVLFFLLLFLTAIFITARALEYQELAP
jgi:uncharacterized integral membrane protein